MALRMWASSTANALRLSTAASKSSLVSPAFSLSRTFATVLEGLKYAKSHEWVKHEGGVATIGITDHAQVKMCEHLVGDVYVSFQDHLGEVVYVELPKVSDGVSQGNKFGVVESVKAASDVYSPISGEVVEINPKLSDTATLINSSPYDDGWMIKVKPSNPSELDSLLGPKEYTKLCEEDH